MKTVDEQRVREFLLNLYRAPLARKGLAMAGNLTV
jgi:hypothetical protein